MPRRELRFFTKISSLPKHEITYSLRFNTICVKDFVDKYGRNFDNSEFAIVYGDYENSENSYKLNELCYYSHLSYLESLEEMRDLGYIKYICNKLNFNDKVVKLMGGK